MPYLGNTPSTSFATVVKDTFNGGSTGYTLSKVATTNSVSVFVENVRQEPTTAYAVSGTTLTFTATTPSGTGNIYVLHMNPTTTTTHPSAQNLTAVDGTFTGNIDVDGTANLDVVDIDGAVDMASTLAITGDTTLSRAETNGTVRLSLSNTGSNGSSEYSEIKLSSTAGTAATSIFQHRNNYGLNLGTTTDNAIYLLQNNSAHTTFETDGDVNIANGNLVIGTGGKGIDFSAQTAASAASASATGELFDRYEEGIFTHTGNANMTINSVSARGFYTIIGDKCFINGFVRFTHSGSDNVSLSLPVAAKGDITSPANGEQESSNVTWMPSVNTSGDTQLVSMYVASGSSSVAFYNLGTGSGLVTNNGCDSTAEFYYNLNYKIA